jgi:S-adenosylmethionine-diacylgycerolhomoserine-N-methlytransferase
MRHPGRAARRSPWEQNVQQTSVQRYYRFHAAIYDWTRWLVLHRRKQAIQHLQLRPDSSVLEIGCGTGLNFGAILAQLDPVAGGLTGVDFSLDMLSRARRRIAARGWNDVELIAADATSLALGRSFDSVLFAYSLSMIPDWEAAVRRAWDHLRPGGQLVILDFGEFRGWGPLGPLARGWLRLNHVATLRAYPQRLPEILGPIQVENWLGGYAFLAAVQKPA